MGSSSRSDLFILCLSVLISLCHSTSLDRSNDALFVFGDSLFDPGNNNYLINSAGKANVWPYGETYFHHPTGRFSDGRIIPDFIAEYAKLPLIPPYLQPGSHQFFTHGSNFASGGAGALSETRPGMVVNLKTQLTYFKTVEKKLKEKLGYTQTEKLLSTAIYMLSFGSNDYAVRVANLTVLQPYTNEEYVGMVIGNITNAIKEIYGSEGRKFGIINFPALSRTPFARSVLSNATSQLSKLEKLHNKALPKALKELQRQLHGFKYSIFDFYASLNERIDRPSKFGFKVVKVACCGSGQYRGIVSTCGRGKYELCENFSDYLFFDGAHPTEKANNQIAKLAWSGNSDYAKPCNIKTLFQI